MASDTNIRGSHAGWDLLGRIWRGPERWLGVAAVVFVAFCGMSYSHWAAEQASHWFMKNKYRSTPRCKQSPTRPSHTGG
jgi:hypothetical protein